MRAITAAYLIVLSAALHGVSASAGQQLPDGWVDEGVGPTGKVYRDTKTGITMEVSNVSTEGTTLGALMNEVARIKDCQTSQQGGSYYLLCKDNSLIMAAPQKDNSAGITTLFCGKVTKEVCAQRLSLLLKRR